jgi:hypothetical protein
MYKAIEDERSRYTHRTGGHLVPFVHGVHAVHAKHRSGRLRPPRSFATRSAEIMPNSGLHFPRALRIFTVKARFDRPAYSAPSERILPRVIPSAGTLVNPTPAAFPVTPCVSKNHERLDSRLSPPTAGLYACVSEQRFPRLQTAGLGAPWCAIARAASTGRFSSSDLRAEGDLGQFRSGHHIQLWSTGRPGCGARSVAARRAGGSLDQPANPEPDGATRAPGRETVASPA